jgi:4-amino-4-deoxy-L-arabinose transferase-like glycosyltransferase
MPISQRIFRLGLLVAILLGMGLRFAHMRTCHNWLFDEHYYYYSTAYNAYQGDGFVSAYSTDREGVFVPSPGQAWFILATLPLCTYTDAEGNDAVLTIVPKLIQVLISGFTIALFGLIGRRLRSPTAGLIAAFAAAIYPGFVHWAGYLMSENNYLFGLALLTWLLLRWIHRPYYRRAVLAAVVLGLLCFQRGNPMLLAPGLAGFSLLIMGWKRGWKPALTFAVLPMLILLPWRQFNVKRHGDPVWVSSNSGIAFHYDNRIDLDPMQMPHWDDMQKTPLIPEIENQFRNEDDKLKTTYYRYAQAYLAHAKAYVLANPGHFLRNYFLKMWNQFTIVPSDAHYSVSFLRSTQLWHGMHHLLLLLGTAGFVLTLVSGRDRRSLLLLTMFAYFAAFGALFHITRDGRMALVLKVYLIFYAAWFIDWLCGLLRAKLSAQRPVTSEAS